MLDNRTHILYGNTPEDLVKKLDNFILKKTVVSVALTVDNSRLGGSTHTAIIVYKDREP